ncbi:VOC family protein [Myxococcota bacterium]|nr:VOC family protein [Myxococcota bacterium]
MPLFEKVGMIIHPVEDLDEAVSFYTDGLGMPLKFRDADRFAALDAGSVTIALATSGEAVTDEPTVSYKVANVEAAIESLVASGAKIQSPPEVGPHEVRAVLRDPAGNPLVVYESR